MNENKDLPLISIGVSAYNRANYLPQCLDSLLAQTYKNCEIIVIDDGSTDNTEELMRSKYPQIKYVRQPNGGDASAKNHAAKIASGEYIVFNDSDDIFYPDAVEQLYNALKGSKNVCSYGTYQTIDADGNEQPTKHKMKSFPSGNITEALLKHIIVNNCGTLIPREIFLEFGGFDTNLKVSYDWAFFLEMAMTYNFNAVQNAVFKRRRHNSNLSSASYAKIRTVSEVFEKHISNHPELESKYQNIIKMRKADFQGKLYRQAKREKLYANAAKHAAAAWKLNRSFKNLLRMLLTLPFHYMERS